MNPLFQRYTALLHEREGVSSKSPPFGAALSAGLWQELRLGGPGTVRVRSRLGLVLSRLDYGREAGNVLALAQPHHDHTLGRTARALDVVDRHPDHRAAVGDEHDLVPV